jgi:hypothetical protein
MPESNRASLVWKTSTVTELQIPRNWCPGRESNRLRARLQRTALPMSCLGMVAEAGLAPAVREVMSLPRCCFSTPRQTGRRPRCRSRKAARMKRARRAASSAMVGRAGIEPASGRYERPVLPLNERPMKLERRPGNDPGDRPWQSRTQTFARTPHDRARRMIWWSASVSNRPDRSCKDQHRPCGRPVTYHCLAGSDHHDRMRLSKITGTEA